MFKENLSSFTKERSDLLKEYINLKNLTNLTKIEKEQLRQKYLQCLYEIELFKSRYNPSTVKEYTVKHYYEGIIPVKYKIMQCASGDYNITICDLLTTH
jgi:hypothetical protein